METKSHTLLKAKGNCCVSHGSSCNVPLKTEKEIINPSQTNITPSLPIHIENIEVLNIDSNTLKIKVTNTNLTPVLITHKKYIAILDNHVHFPCRQESLHSKIKSIDFSNSDINQQQKNELITL